MTRKVHLLEAQLIAAEPDPPVGRAVADVAAMVERTNPYHDKDGKFASGHGGGATGAAALGAAPLGLADVKVGIDGKVTAKPGAGMDAAEAKSLNNYQNRGFVNINKKLRKGGGEIPPGADGEHIRNMDSAMRKSKLTKDVSVERGCGPTAFGDKWHGDMTGHTFVDHGFVSTTTSKATAADFKGFRTNYSSPENGAHVHIHVPAGTSAVRLSGAEHESELLLDRGLAFKVVSDTGPGADRVIHLQVGSP